jgi:hypothetical protein
MPGAEGAGMSRSVWLTSLAAVAVGYVVACGSNGNDSSTDNSATTAGDGGATATASGSACNSPVELPCSDAGDAGMSSDAGQDAADADASTDDGGPGQGPPPKDHGSGDNQN